MTNIYGSPIGTYTHAVTFVSGAKAEVTANIEILKSLLDDGHGGAGHPDFNKINAGVRAAIVGELNGIEAAIAAA